MQEIHLSKKEIQHRLNTIRIKPNGLQPRKYGVTVKYFSDNDNNADKRIDYEVTAKLNIHNGIGELALSKENIYYNQHEPDFINEIIANAISKSIYPIKVAINEKGMIDEEINNHKDILERWQHYKSVLLEKYNSEDLDSFLKVFENKLADKLQVERNLHFDWFWNLFCHPKLVNYGDTRTIEKDLYLAVIPYQSPLKFSGIQKIEKIPTNYHSFMVQFTSKEFLAPSYFKTTNNQHDIYMQLQVDFDMDLYHHFPMHTRAHFEIYDKNKQGEKQILRKTLFTMYQLNTDEYENKLLSADSPFITGGLVKLPPNKWGFDNFENLENNW